MGVFQAWASLLWQQGWKNQSKTSRGNRGRSFNVSSNTLFFTRRTDSVVYLARLVRGGESRAMDILHTRLDELHRVGINLLPWEEIIYWLVFSYQLAHALVEHETLNADEVRKVIKGEPIRDISQVLEDDLSRTRLPAEPLVQSVGSTSLWPVQVILTIIEPNAASIA